MNILVTGAVGFIGFSLCETLIKKKHKVFGIDNFDTYYSIEIKKKRLKILNKNLKGLILQKSQNYLIFIKKKKLILLYI